MLSTQTRTAVAGLASAVLSLRPLIDRLDEPVAVAPASPGAQRVLDRVAGRLGAPRFAPLASSAADTAPAGLDTFGAAVSRRLDLAAREHLLDELADDRLAAVDLVVDEIAADDFAAFCTPATVRGPDGATVRAYAAGDPRAPAVVIASACGMPVRLAESWIRRLAADYFVLTWESRGLFGDDLEDFDGATGVAAQCGDLFAVMDHFGVASAHVAGLCGGAVLALAAAAERPRRISSLSLWHGDFEVGDDTLKTDHQRNLQALMNLAVTAPMGAAGVHAVLCQSMASATPLDLAHLVLYPYATPELLRRYCLLNGAIMQADARPWLAAVKQPTLVVTSADDSTAHPAGSRFAAAALSGARLLVLPHGDHISLFRGDPGLLDTAAGFIADPRV
ncbi:MAG TPA: alpha/beta fold hydrolase [Actinocrinis sp.]|nr:alpha/beta fold hydrolase [Actinocrinis sp.]